MALPTETIAQVARAYDMAYPAATEAPALLFARQDEEMQTCGYWSFSDRDLPFSEYLCGGAGCTTSAEYHGCADTFATTCYNSDDSYCGSDASLAPGDLCCTESTWNNCVTATKSDGGRLLTAFECWAGLSGEQSIFVTPYERTVVRTEGDSTITSTESKTGVETSSATGERDNQATTSTSSGTPEKGGGGSSAPIGAIVGGVIGGIALILIVAFGIWFMRFYKRKHAGGQPGAEPYRGTETGYYGAGAGYQDPSAAGSTGSPPAPGSTAGYYNGAYQQPGANGWGYQLPPEQKPEQQAPVEMPDDHNRRPGPTHELQ